jgi:heme/copper-type cytochrome/quinol oxidase subunit 1
VGQALQRQYGQRMPRWALFVLLIAAVVCAGIGSSLLDPLARASFGWTAYAPLSIHSGSAVYRPIDPTWLQWRPRVGTALLPLGAGTAGAFLVAIVTTQRTRA